MLSQTALRSFLIAKRAEGLAPRTISAHEQALSLFLRRAAGEIEDITRDHIRLFLANPAWSKNTRLLRWKGLDAFFRFCLDDGILTASPMDGVPRPRAGGPRRPPQYTDVDIAALLAVCPQWTWIGLRDQAIIRTLWTSAARNAELCGLLVDDVDWDTETLTLRGKGGVTYRAVLFPETARALDRYLRLRPFDHPALFITEGGRALSPHALQLILRRLKDRSGMTKPLYAHAFRHNWGMRSLQWGLALNETAKTMGHRSTKATEIYQQWTAEQSALDKVRRRLVG